MSQKKYLDYEGLQELVAKINEKYAPIAAIIFKGTVEDIAHLPALNTQKAGFMYNVTKAGITTDDFVEGKGHDLAAGENVAAVELLTGEFTKVVSPAETSDPKALGWYEVDTVDYVDITSELKPTDNPKEMGLYVASSTPGEYELTTDETPQSGTTYYYKDVTYKLSQDRQLVDDKDYFTADTVMKWDILGGVFNLEDRYLEFGKEFPEDPEDERTFLYMGETEYKYTEVTPEAGDNPKENGWYEEHDEYNAVTPEEGDNPQEKGWYEKEERYDVITPAGTENPQELGWYEISTVTPAGTENPSTEGWLELMVGGYYVVSTDTTVDGSKTYYVADLSSDTAADLSKTYVEFVEAYTLSADTSAVTGKTYYEKEEVYTLTADTTVKAGKDYFVKEEKYVKGVIYVYDETEQEWLAQTAGDTYVPITKAEIDELFI